MTLPTLLDVLGGRFGAELTFADRLFGEAVSAHLRKQVHETIGEDAFA